jgi:ABC-type antimicrobial peptide transport system permease subunit
LSQEKKKIAVMRAYGVQKQHILFQRIFKATVLSFISSIFVYLIVYILQFTRLNLIFDLSVDIKVYIIILIKVQIISIIFTTNMARKLLKKEIAVILRENN